MKNIRRSLRGALLAGPAVLLLACGDAINDPRLQTFMGCPVREIVVDESRGGTLSSGDCLLEGAYTDMYYLEVFRDSNLIIDLESFDFDAYLVLYDRDTGELLADNDDLNSFDSDARLAGDLPRGRYVIGATSFYVGETGQYVITVD